MSPDYSHLPARVALPCPAFEAFFADMVRRIPALQGSGAITIPPAGFKRALKTAYLAGEHDALARVLAPEEAAQADARDDDHEISSAKSDDHG